jgi:hypothetical protein
MGGIHGMKRYAHVTGTDAAALWTVTEVFLAIH